ncbi:MAG TPA: protein kinase [Candidatus Polarisedimenticolaceae bacterium]|nr:protein kinase [Candidatus Polarisedimenticolaceae bacterium]
MPSCAVCGHTYSSGDCPRCLLGLGLETAPPPIPERLGAYTIVARLGEGGMGEVYRAHDDRLNRDVAIKVLPDVVAQGEEHIARFKREARMAASLNHPNIAAVYGFEEDEGTHFLVMELVPGETLAERLRSGPIPLAETLALTGQIASGLEAAHERGIVHRDLKPGNVKITPTGQVKILDFGLAKAVGETPEAPAPITARYTSPGTVIGTVPYMSPEQARGRIVDRRTDIWSLGCVLYECLAGRRAFDGDTATDVVAKILERDPDWSALPARTPPRLRELIERCLEKDPARRLRDAGDLRLELDHATDPPPRASRRPVLLWTIGIVAVGVALLETWRAGSTRARPQVAAPIPLHVVVTDPDVPRVGYEDTPSLAISPDGTTIAYTGRGAADVNGAIGLYVRRIDGVHARRIEVPCGRAIGRTQEAFDPFFSPDGASVGFSCGNMYRIPLSGGTAVPLVESEIPLKGATWTPRGIVFAPAAKSGLVLVHENGGPLETLTIPDASKNEVSHRWPSAHADGRHVLFTIKKEGITSFDQAEIALLDLDTREVTTVVEGGSFARWLPDGRILFARGGTLLAVPLDLTHARVSGAPAPYAEGVMTEPGSGAAQFAVAGKTGALVFVPGGSDVTRNELTWIDRHGVTTPVGAPAQHYHTTIVSPDGTRLASTVFGATDAVFVYDLERRSLARITSEGNAAPLGWSPDGRQVLWGTDRGGLALELGNADGAGTPRRLPLDPASSASPRELAQLEHGLALVYPMNGTLWAAPVEDPGPPRKLGDLPNGVTRIALSPDGRWLAYACDASGRSEIYVRPFPNGSGTWQISRNGGESPAWASHGGELSFQRRSGDGDWVDAVRIGVSGNQIVAGVPVDLFQVPKDLIVWGPHPDGERFIAVRAGAPAFKGDRVEAIFPSR